MINNNLKYNLTKNYKELGIYIKKNMYLRFNRFVFLGAIRARGSLGIPRNIFVPGILWEYLPCSDSTRPYFAATLL